MLVRSLRWVPPTTPFFRRGQRRGFTFGLSAHRSFGPEELTRMEPGNQDAGPYIPGLKTPRLYGPLGKISGCSYVSKDEGHNENYSHRFSARSPHTFPDDGGPVFWRAKWDDPGLGNCDLHECVRLFLLGQNRFAVQRRAACFARRVAESLCGDGAYRG